MDEKVWGSSNLTIALSDTGFRLWIGTFHIDCLENVSINAKVQSKPEVTVKFMTSVEPALQLIIEENIRKVAQFSWIRITR